MELYLNRVFKISDKTIGYLYVDGMYFCDTLEDPIREVKIPNDTAIPDGTYKVILDYSNRFQKIMPHILDVSNFKGVRIHSGNTEKDTSGCILVGDYLGDGLINSRKRYNSLMSLLKVAGEIALIIK